MSKYVGEDYFHVLDWFHQHNKNQLWFDHDECRIEKHLESSAGIQWSCHTLESTVLPLLEAQLMNIHH